MESHRASQPELSCSVLPARIPPPASSAGHMLPEQVSGTSVLWLLSESCLPACITQSPQHRGQRKGNIKGKAQAGLGLSYILSAKQGLPKENAQTIPQPWRKSVCYPQSPGSDKRHETNCTFASRKSIVTRGCIRISQCRRPPGWLATSTARPEGAALAPALALQARETVPQSDLSKSIQLMLQSPCCN